MQEQQVTLEQFTNSVKTDVLRHLLGTKDLQIAELSAALRASEAQVESLHKKLGAIGKEKENITDHP